MTEKFVKRIRTADGNLQIDYNALANLPIIDTELDTSSNHAIANSAVSILVEDINTALDEIIAIQDDLLVPDGNGVAY